MNQALGFIFFVVLCFGVVIADVPVHCEFPQIRGIWEFSLTSNHFTKDVFAQCHLSTKPIPVYERFWIQLEGPNKAAIVQQTPPYSPISFGNWTLMADEGFDIAIRGQRFFANFNWTEDSSSPGGYRSLCSQTATGTYHEDASNPQMWGCFTGRLLYQAKLDAGIFSEASDKAKSLKEATKKLVSQSSYSLYSSKKHSKDTGRLVNRLEKVKFNHNPTEWIKKINQAQNNWVAGPAPEQWKGLTELEVLKKGGRIAPKNEIEGEKRTMEIMKSFKANQEKKKNIELPENWDWTNITGNNYVPPVRNQLHCGSCFAFAGTEMMGARLRILTRMRDQTIFSPQHVVSCSKYTQGCEGGFGYLVGKFANDFGILSEYCMPYQAEDTPCKTFCGPYEAYYGNNYDYVGGYYGGCSEQDMMEALFTRGPMVVGMYVYPEFKYYKGGIYHHVEDGINEHYAQNDGKPDPHYEATNHAVLLVGYGVENGVKFWKVMNSWSETWGEQGFFRILRGTNECHIEFKAEEAMIIPKMGQKE